MKSQRPSRGSAVYRLLATALLFSGPPLARAETARWTAVSGGTSGYSGYGTATAIDTRRGQAVMFGMWLPPSCFRTTCSDYQDVAVTSFARLQPDPLITAGEVLPGSPSPRSGAAAAYDSLNDRVWLFGGQMVIPGHCPTPGCPQRAPLNDLWYLDLSVNPPQWHSVPLAFALPPGRADASLVVEPVGGRLYLLAGHDSTGTTYNDVWSRPLDVVAGWTELAPSGAPPTPRWLATALVDPTRARILLVGGRDAAGDRADVWELALAGAHAWSPLSIAGTPPAGTFAAALDAGRDLVLAYGGPSQIATFQLTGSPVWTPVSTVGAPASFSLGGFGYDPRHDLYWLPYEYTCCFGLGGGFVEHWNFTLAAPPVTPALDPVQDSVTFARGFATQWWRLRPRRSSYSSVRANTPGRGTLGALPGAESPDIGVKFVGLIMDPGQRMTSRLSWLENGVLELGSDAVWRTADSPLTMDLTVDSARFDNTGRVLAVWHCADDSLSLLTPYFVDRLQGSVWNAIRNDWPDTSLRIVVDEVLAEVDTAADYRVRWSGPLPAQFVSSPVLHVSREGISPPPPPPPSEGVALRLGVPVPNPAKRTVHFTLASSRETPVTLRLIDVRGRCVRARSVAPAQLETVTMDLTGVAQGVYTIEATQGGARRTIRVTILR